jgi:hypothetical protein
MRTAVPALRDVEDEANSDARRPVTDRGASTTTTCIGSNCTCTRRARLDDYSFCNRHEYRECTDRSCEDCRVTDTECDEDATADRNLTCAYGGSVADRPTNRDASRSGCR